MTSKRIGRDFIKSARFRIPAIVLMLSLGLTACSGGSVPNGESASSQLPVGQIYLYGEIHGNDAIMGKELELWRDFYHKDGMRHLFVEYPCYTAEFLNLWMKSDDDAILDAVYEDWAGTLAKAPANKEFLKKIKKDCPETIFHGTDVGHQYDTTGKRFLRYLEQNAPTDSEQYSRAQEGIEQGKRYYESLDDDYRETKMTENFIREFDSLDGGSVMGIYGRAHTGLDEADSTGAASSMADRLKTHYDAIVHSEDLWTYLGPSRVDAMEVDGKNYEAFYFGEQDLTGLGDYAHRKFWRLENAYEDFKGKPKTGDLLPYDNYPMPIEAGQVFAIDYAKTDGSVVRMYYRSDGNEWNGSPATEQFAAE